MSTHNSHFYPAARGLYDPRFEHDACGVSFVAQMKGIASHNIVRLGIGALCNMEHRGATGAEADTGDGAGILIQVPDAFCRAVAGVELPAAGAYGVGLAFMPQAASDVALAVARIEAIFAESQLRVLAWRDVPVNPSCLGATALAVMPTMRQIFVSDAQGTSGIELDRKLFIARKRVEHELPAELSTYFPSLSARTLVYKGMFTTPELGEFFPDLSDERMESALALVHSRFSTNTFPSWPLAHPYRFIAHNGEINTVQGNRNWMRTRESLLSSELLPDLEKAFPICTVGGSDSMSFDETLEVIHLAGRSLPHAVLMMIPEAWQNNDRMDAKKRAFYEYHGSLMEPWDGPASVAFTDGTVIGAVLDRNGLRPSRYWVTDDDLVVMASESGVLDIAPERVVKKGRLQPGRMFLIDTEQRRIIEDEEIKRTVVNERPYAEWLGEHLVHLKDLPPAPQLPAPEPELLRARQIAFGYTFEDQRILMAPMAKDGVEAVGSMGNDTPLAVLSKRSRLIYDYFKQLFAQVTNPPIDSIREEIITSSDVWLGSEGNLLDPKPSDCRRIELKAQILIHLINLALNDFHDGKPLKTPRQLVFLLLLRLTRQCCERTLKILCHVLPLGSRVQSGYQRSCLCMALILTV